MIILYSGIPGSGKTYKMVSDLNDCQKDFYVVHNIDGLQEDFLKSGINFVKYCDEHQMKIEEFFSKEYQISFTEEVKKKYDLNCLVIIDEAHEWFSSIKDSLKMWLSYHRHLNQTIWLVAHKSTNIPAIYRSFVEVEFRAKHSSILSLPMVFFYNRIVGGEQLGYVYCFKKKAIFKLYKSQNKGFVKKRPSLFFPIVVLFVVLGVSYFFIMPRLIIGKGKKNKNKEEVKIVNKVSDDREYRLVGSIGESYLLEDKDRHVIKLSDVKDKYVLLSQDIGKDSIMVIDIKSNKKIIINKLAWQDRPATTEPVGSQP